MLQHIAAQLMEKDVTEVDKSDVARACFSLGFAYLSSVLKKIDPPFRKTFLICFASKKGWLKNYNWKQSQSEATEEQQRAVMNEMQRLLRESAMRIELVEGEMEQ